MSTQTVRIDQLADAVMKGLEEYAKLATDDLKKDVQKAGKKVPFRASAPIPTWQHRWWRRCARYTIRR